MNPPRTFIQHLTCCALHLLASASTCVLLVADATTNVEAMAWVRGRKSKETMSWALSESRP